MIKFFKQLYMPLMMTGDPRQPVRGGNIFFRGKMKIRIFSEFTDQPVFVSTVIGFSEVYGNSIDKVDKIAMLCIDDVIAGFEIRFPFYFHTILQCVQNSKMHQDKLLLRIRGFNQTH